MQVSRIGIIYFLCYMAISAWCRGTGCPFHVCTAENLKCANKRLVRNAEGCFICRCDGNEANRTQHPCLLHGCTVELLKCESSKLREDKKGCALCECEGSGTNQTVPIKFGDSTSSGGSIPLFDSGGSNTPACRPPNCTAAELNCSRLAQDPSGCRVCRCALDSDGSDGMLIGSVSNPIFTETDLDIGQPCPDPHEILEDEVMREGVNRGRRPLYKLVLKKLRKGFKPGKKYKILVKARSKSKPFKAVLIDLKAAPAGTSGKGRKRGHSASAAAYDATCGAGELQQVEGVRIVPNCPTAAVEGDTKNKTKLFVKWIAPPCGCVYVRATVIDFTDRFAFFDEGLAPSSDGVATPGKVNKALYKTVCARKRTRKPRPADKNPPREEVKSWIATACCNAAISLSTPSAKKRMVLHAAAEICERQAKLYGRGWNPYNRYRVMQRACKREYKKCCLMIYEVMKQKGIVFKPTSGAGRPGVAAPSAFPASHRSSNRRPNKNKNKRLRPRRRKSKSHLSMR